MATRPEFRQLVLRSITYVGPAEYQVDFDDKNTGEEVVARCHLMEASGPMLANFRPDVFTSWFGDAESVRSVTAAVLAVERARQLSLRDYDAS